MNWLQFFRKTHLYIGVFTAPAILFFALTGALQTFSLHESARDSNYKPPQWILLLAQIHKKQTTQIPVRKAQPQSAPVNAAGEKKPDEKRAEPSAPTQPKRNALPLKIFFLIVALSLFLSTLSGLYLAWKYRRDRILATALLLAGILVPILLMQF
ncbi:PepSY domain-containing protein [Acidobacteria bacterium AB60]|nr:PepSY domain-containing protein [Acidobacteria bacterium AB60]